MKKSEDWDLRAIGCHQDVEHLESNVYGAKDQGRVLIKRSAGCKIHQRSQPCGYIIKSRRIYNHQTAATGIQTRVCLHSGDLECHKNAQ